jgi:hypothetical protein
LVSDDGMTTYPRAPSAHWFCNVLQRLRTHIVEDDIDLPADLALRVVRDADAAGLCDPLQTRSDVDAVTEDIVIIDDNVADVNADAKFDPDILRHIGILSGHAVLDLYCASRGIDGAGKLYQHTVAGRLNYPASMCGDRGIDNRLSEGLEPGQRAFLVRTH